MTQMIYRGSAASIGGRGVLVEGAPGSGKSSLILALIDRGACLIGDDGVTVQMRDQGLLLSPPPNIAGKLEIRNVGLVELPVCSAPLSLVIRLDLKTPRFAEEAEETEIASVRVPLIRLWPESPVLPLRAEWALRIHGL